MPVCCSHIFIQQQTQGKRYSVQSPYPAFYIYPPPKDLAFEIRADLCILSDKRIDHTDQSEYIAGHSRICKSEFCAHICFPGTKRLQETPQFPYDFKECAFMHLILDKCCQTLFFLYQ